MRMLTSVPTVTPADLWGPSAGTVEPLVIDLRSPGEYAQDHAPGAHSVPLFSDAERALIGTLYRRHSPEAAFTEGRLAARTRICELVETIGALAGWRPPAQVRERGPGSVDELFEAVTSGGIEALERDVVASDPVAPPRRPVVLHCWRGGLRSRSVAGFLRLLGLDRAVVLEGGYRAYRAHVLGELERWAAPPTFVLRGLTGVGKTLVLRELERQRPGWTLDLEGLAGHRSSILGMVGLEPVSQKRFDSLLAERLRAGFDGPVVVEGESRKVGDTILPASVWEALQGGHNALLEAPTERRIDVLIEDYLERAENRVALRGQLPFIERRLGPVKWAGALVALLDQGRERELVEVLLEQYYDPLYLHSEKGRSYELTVDTSDPVRAAGELADWVDQTLRRSSASPSRACARSS